MSATIPITLTPVPVPVGVKATDINQLVTIITQYIAGSINQDVSFFQISGMRFLPRFLNNFLSGWFIH